MKFFEFNVLKFYCIYKKLKKIEKFESNIQL